MLPWISATRRDPAARWRPSTFCVTRRKSGLDASTAARAAWPGFGMQPRILCLRHWYHSHTSRGSAANAPGVASDIGSLRFHNPSGPRNVGTPLSADTPAPVSTHRVRQSRSQPLAVSISRVIAGPS